MVRCLWHGRRMGRGRVSVKEIRRWCLHCCGVPLDSEAPEGVMAEAKHGVETCTGRMIDGSECSLHPYRMGTLPGRRGKSSTGRSAEAMRSINPNIPEKRVDLEAKQGVSDASKNLATFKIGGI